MEDFNPRQVVYIRIRRSQDLPVSTELESEINFHSSFTATTMLHPATYLNKVIVGSAEGAIQLWNVRTMYVNLASSRIVDADGKPRFTGP